MIVFIDRSTTSFSTTFPVADILATETKEERRRRQSRESSRRWHANNLEKSRENSRRWRANNLEKSREQFRLWRKSNPEKAYECNRRWAESNPEKVREKSRVWREKNPEKAREYSRQYRAKRARVRASLAPSVETLKTSLLQNDLYAEASRQVPAGLPGFIRDDIISDIVIAVLDGEIRATDIALKAKDIMKAYWRQFGDQRLVSLDGTIPGTDLKRIDTISNEDALYAG